MTQDTNTIPVSIDAIEDNRIEASLRVTFAGDVERLQRLHEDGGATTWGWAILGGQVLIHRETLPVDCSRDDEVEAIVRHRQEILDIVRSAYNAGRMHAEAVDDLDPKLAAALARLSELKDAWEANEARIARALRGRHA